MKPFENIVEKGENAGNHHFLLYTHIFYPSKPSFNSSLKLTLLSANAFNLDKSKIVLFGKELNSYPSKYLNLKPSPGSSVASVSDS